MKSPRLLAVAALNLLFVASTLAQAQTAALVQGHGPVSETSILEIDVHGADVYILSGNVDTVLVKIELTTDDMAAGRKYIDEQDFELGFDGEVVYIKSRSSGNRSWNTSPDQFKIVVRAHIPTHFTVNVRNGDGDVSLNQLVGDLQIKTVDGDISVGSVKGDEVELRTADGDIFVESVDGESVYIHTVDGDVTLGDVKAANTAARASDGDIAVNYLSGETVYL